MRSRLMDANMVAAYLDMARSTFDGKRKMMEAAGFPPPALSRDEFGSAKWDRMAIDAWLNKRSGLGEKRAAPASEGITHVWEDRLIERAHTMAAPVQP